MFVLLQDSELRFCSAAEGQNRASGRRGRKEIGLSPVNHQFISKQIVFQGAVALKFAPL